MIDLFSFFLAMILYYIPRHSIDTRDKHMQEDSDGINNTEKIIHYCHPSLELRTKIRALFTNARTSSSKAHRSYSETLISFRFAAVANNKSGRAISSSSS